MAYIGYLSLEGRIAAEFLPQYLSTVSRYHELHHLDSPTKTILVRDPGESLPPTLQVLSASVGSHWLPSVSYAKGSRRGFGRIRYIRHAMLRRHDLFLHLPGTRGHGEHNQKRRCVN